MDTTINNSAALTLFQYLYDYKSLSIPQCWQAAYQDLYSNPGSCYQEQLLPLINQQLLRVDTSSFFQYRLSLTATGIDFLRNSKNIPRYNENGKRNYKIPKDLSLEDLIVPHQLSLNQFLLDFRDWMNTSDISVPYQIKVEKLDEKYDWFRPDAIITLDTENGPVHLYIEQDMGTEERKPLMRKWDRYHKYILAKKGDRNFGRMVMLFIINYDTSSPAPHNLNFDDFEHCIEYRKRELFRSIPFLFPDMLDGFFEAYMGTEKDILETVFFRILQESENGHGYYHETFLERHPDYSSYKVNDAGSLAKDFGGIRFESYVRLLHNSKIVPGTAMVCDNAEYLPLSIFAKTKYMDRANAYFAGNHHGAPEIKYMLCDCDQKNRYVNYCNEMELPRDKVIIR